MLKKILVLVLSLAFVFSSAVSLVGASYVAGVSDTMSRQKLSVVSTHSIAVDMSTSVAVDAGDTFIYTFTDNPGDGTWTFPADGTWASTDFTFNDGTARTVLGTLGVGGTPPTCTPGVNNVSVTVNQSAKAITVTACSTYTASAASAIATLTIGTATGGITNPGGTAGSYEIWVTGSFGDSQSEAEVPTLTDDQVSVNASVDTYISFNATTSSGTAGTLSLGELSFAAVTSSNDAARTDAAGSTLAADNISLTLNTNAYYGTVVQVSSANGGLKSTAAGNYTLTSATETLAVNQNTVSDTAGYGLQAQDSAPTVGTLTKQSPYSSTGNAVGLVSSTFATLYQTANLTGSTSNPIVGGSMVVYVLAVPAKNTPAADDYTDTLTFRATSTF
mgnify:CR=1 FL=1